MTHINKLVVIKFQDLQHILIFHPKHGTACPPDSAGDINPDKPASIKMAQAQHSFQYPLRRLAAAAEKPAEINHKKLLGYPLRWDDRHRRIERHLPFNLCPFSGNAREIKPAAFIQYASPHIIKPHTCTLHLITDSRIPDACLTAQNPLKNICWDAQPQVPDLDGQEPLFIHPYPNLNLGLFLSGFLIFKGVFQPFKEIRNNRWICVYFNIGQGIFQVDTGSRIARLKTKNIFQCSPDIEMHHRRLLRIRDLFTFNDR